MPGPASRPRLGRSRLMARQLQSPAAPRGGTPLLSRTYRSSSLVQQRNCGCLGSAPGREYGAGAGVAAMKVCRDGLAGCCSALPALGQDVGLKVKREEKPRAGRGGRSRTGLRGQVTSPGWARVPTCDTREPRPAVLDTCFTHIIHGDIGPGGAGGKARARPGSGGQKEPRGYAPRSAPRGKAGLQLGERGGEDTQVQVPGRACEAPLSS